MLTGIDEKDDKSLTEVPQNTLTNIWKHREPLYGTPFTISGHSRAAERSSFYVPELSILFDTGISTMHSPLVVAITHCHADHCCSLPMVLLNWDIGYNEMHPDGTFNPKKRYILVPENQKSLFEECVSSMFSLWREFKREPGRSLGINGMEADATCELTEVDPKLKGVFIKSYQMDHTVNCLGYGIIEKKQKLREKFRGLPGKEIVELKKSGVEITESIDTYQFVYMGDTSISVFEEKDGVTPELFKYKTIIVECTFLADDDLEQTKSKKHIHWQELKKYILEYPGIEFILIHFSMKYKNSEVKAFFDKEMAENGIKNVHPWMN